LAAGPLLVALAQADAAAQVAEPVEITPLLECVATNGDGSLTAKFGWDNRGGRTYRPLAGTENRIVPSKYQKLLKTEFSAGRVTTKNGGFTVTFAEGEKITWVLFDQPVEASAASQPCPRDERGAPQATRLERTTTTVAKGAGPPAARGKGPPAGQGPAGGSLPPVVAAGADAAGGSLGAADVVPALVLGLLVLGMVAFGLEAAARQPRS
jgi:hypothetical protein